MEHIADHNTQPAQPEGFSVPLDQQEETPAVIQGVPKRRFIAVSVLAIALAGLCGWLVFRCIGLDRQYAAQLATVLDAQDTALSQANADLTAAQAELAQRELELSQAQDTIDLLKEYSVAAPDGTVPEYTQLYPDFYVQPWDGEIIDGGKVCCLTFDDGPSANTDRILEILDRYGIKATFFVVGKTGAADQERMRKIVEAGHTLAMHSWSHSYQSVYASVESFLDEFYRLYQWIYEVTGVYPSVYRFPGGSINGYDRGVYQEIIAEMTRRGFVYFDWNASAQDATVTPRPAADITADCLRGIGRDLVVILSHDSAARGTTVDALPAIIEGYQAAGYSFSALHPGVTPVTMGYPKIQ